LSLQGPIFGSGCALSFVAELSRLRTDDLPYKLPRNAEVTTYRLDRLIANEIRATDLRNSLHDQHSNLGSHEKSKPVWSRIPGVRLDADHPEKGVLIPCKTHSTTKSSPNARSNFPITSISFRERKAIDRRRFASLAAPRINRREY
jgi:hypothetical protein